MRKLGRRSILRGGGLASFWGGVLSRAPRTAVAQQKAVDGSPLDTGTSEMRPVIERYGVELRDLNRVYALPGSPVLQKKLEGFYAGQLRLLDAMNFDAFSQAGKVDYLLIRNSVGGWMCLRRRTA